MLKKLCVSTMMFLLLLPSVPAWPAEGPKLEKLVIGYAAPVASLGIIDVIKKGGLFRKHGLDVELVFIQGSGILTAAMVSGQVPLTFLAGAAVVSSAIGGADTVLTSCAINTLFWRLFSTPNIRTIADLKNKKIGVTRLGTLEDGVLRYLLKERGLNPDRDVAFIAIGAAPQRVIALSRGLIDASSFIAPQDIQAQKLGMHELLDMSKLGLYNPASCFATTKSYIRTNRDTVARVMRAFTEGIKFYRDNREFALKVTADFAKNNDPAVLNASYDSVIRFQDKAPYVNPKGIDFILKVIEDRDPRAKNFDPQSVVDSSFIQELDKSGFIEALWRK
jgi:ABC-type nitrate/sulfonate/bicarbonate transport system substrate-binding protein